MEVREHFIACINPVYKGESAIQLDEETKLDMMEQELENLEKVEVHAVGNLVEGIETGDKVFMEPGKILRAPRLTIGETNYFFIRQHDIIFKYNG